MRLRPDRRAFIGGSLGLGTFALLGCRLTGSQAQDSDLKNAATGSKLFVRKAVTSPEAAKDIELYKKAVTILKANKVWTAQATIHQNFSTHGNWFFLPWHRFYLMYFEEVCREALRGAGETGDFSLPYWSWPDTGRKIPEIAWGDGNPLFDNTREMGPNDILPDAACGAGTVATIMRTNNFLDFGGGRASTQQQMSGVGGLEATPHNAVHARCGGDMSNFMSPLDPLFWMHHANVDRLWAQWQLDHPGRIPTNPHPGEKNATTATGVVLDGSFWLNYALDGYEDLKGGRFTQVLKDCIDHTKMPKPYTYDVLLKPAAVAVETQEYYPTASIAGPTAAATATAEPPALSVHPAAAGASTSAGTSAAAASTVPAAAGLRLSDGSTTVRTPTAVASTDRIFVQSAHAGLVVKVDQATKIVSANIHFSDKIKPYMAKLSGLPSYTGALTLIVENIPVPTDDLAHRISLDFYANHPELTTETDASDPHFLSSYAFFAHNHPGAPQAISLRIALNQPFLKLRAAGFELRDSMLLQVLVKDRLLQTLPSLSFLEALTFRVTYTET